MFFKSGFQLLSSVVRAPSGHGIPGHHSLGLVGVGGQYFSEDNQAKSRTMKLNERLIPTQGTILGTERLVRFSKR